MSALKDLWSSGGTALGAWLSLRDPLVAEAAAASGYDYVCIDMQHGLAELGDAWAMLQAMARTAPTPIMRVPWNEPGIIGRVLDAGALGVIIPMVNSPDEARAAVAACRYAPGGARSFGPMTAGTRFGGAYGSTANAEVACIPMIETRQAVEQIDDILAVPGIDAIYIGPADLSLTYGLTPGLDNPDDVFQSALTRVVDSCRRHNVIAGIHASAALAQRRHDSGFRLITVGFDFQPIVAALRADLATARKGTGAA